MYEHGERVRSVGVHFETLEKRAGHTLSMKPVFYSFLDKNPSNGVNYYRLSQVDSNGAMTIFGIKSVDFSTSKANIKVAPNPSKNGYIRFEITNFEVKTGKIVVTDVLGKVVFNAATQQSNVSTNLPTGVYFAQLWDATTVLGTQKFVIE